MKIRACQLFDDFIISKDLAPEVRTAGLVHIYEGLEHDGKLALAFLLKGRSIKQVSTLGIYSSFQIPNTFSIMFLQDTLANYISLVRARTAHQGDFEQESNLNKFYQVMLNVFPTSDKKATLLVKLSSSKDRNLYTLLDIVASPDSSLAEVTLLSHYTLLKHTCLMHMYVRYLKHARTSPSSWAARPRWVSTAETSSSPLVWGSEALRW